MTTTPTFLNYATPADIATIPPASGSLVSIQYASFDGSFSIMSWIGKMTDTYDEYLIKVRGVGMVNAGGLGLRFGNDSIFRTDGNYRHSFLVSDADTNVKSMGSNTASTYIRLNDGPPNSGSIQNSAGWGDNMDIRILHSRDAAKGTTIIFDGGHASDSSYYEYNAGSGAYNTTQTHSSVQVFATTGGNLVRGSMELFGVAK